MGRGRVKSWNDEEGWGVLTSPEVPGEIWTIFCELEMDGYRNLDVGQEVEFEGAHYPPG